MVLIVTNECDITTDYVVLRLQARGVPYLRLNTERFPGDVTISIAPTAEGCVASIEAKGSELKSDTIDAVWYRRPLPPELPGSIPSWQQALSRDESGSVLFGLYFALSGSLWVSRPDAIARAERKVVQLAIARATGFKVPRTLATNSPDKARAFIDSVDAGVVIKLMGRGHVVDKEAVHTLFTTILDATDRANLEALTYCPCLFQEFIPKAADIRVTVVGRKVFAAEIDSQSNETTRVDWRVDPSLELPTRQICLPNELLRACRDIVRQLGLQFGAVDLGLTSTGECYFFEINPNGQWAWLEDDAGLPISDAITDLLTGKGDPL